MHDAFGNGSLPGLKYANCPILASHKIAAKLDRTWRFRVDLVSAVYFLSLRKLPRICLVKLLSEDAMILFPEI